MTKVVVGMSGGVDSSVAAFLLKEQGYEVIGVTMEIWSKDASPEEDGGCCGLSAVDDARRVAAAIDIPYYVMNFRDVFEKTVIDYFAREYQLGRTPNPCIACNRYVKWEALLNRSLAIGADYIATGHYGRVKKLQDGRYTLAASAAAAKDQTYALYNLTQDQLSHTLMPVGDYTKDEIRAIAEREDLPVAHKPDSQEICFIPDHDYASFVHEYTGRTPLPGNFVDTDGNFLGRHRGITHYTVGQRKGLGTAFGKPMFVKKICPETNEVVLCESGDVWGDHLTMKGLNFMALPDFDPDQILTGKIRYNHSGAPCRVKRTGPDTAEVFFEEAVRAITPGQAAVFYTEDGCVAGGGIIEGT